MGFRTGAFLKVWEINPVNGVCTRIRGSISKKNKQTGGYEQDFSGFIACFGTAAASMAAGLKVGDVIKIGDCDVSTSYDKEKKINYTDFKIFSFDLAQQKAGNSAPEKKKAESNPVDANDVEEDDLPF